MSFRFPRVIETIAAVAMTLAAATASAADAPRRVTLDWAYYNPLSLVLKQQRLVEAELPGVEVRWVQSLGSNKALEFLNSGSLDVGSSAGAAALLAKVNGSPIKSIYVYSRPEWTALVTRPGAGIAKVEDLRGKRVAVTRGTDPYIFLVRALNDHGLTERDIKPVLLQHQDGRTALIKGDVDAWAGLDPMMAQAELEEGSTLFYRNAGLNTWGVLNVREEFARNHPETALRVLAAYEKARAWALKNPEELNRILAEAAKLNDAVAARKLERTELTHSRIGTEQADTIIAAGIALQKGGVIPDSVDVKATVASLIDPTFTARLASAAR